MAKSAEKKEQQTYQWYSKTFLAITAGLHLFYFLIRVVYRWDSYYFKDLFGYLIALAINLFGLKLLFSYLSLGHPYTSYSYLVDILGVNWFVLFGIVFSNWFFLVYLTIPGYLMHQYGHYITNWWKQRQEQNAMMEKYQQEQAAQLQQQQQQPQKQKVRYVKH